MGTHGRNAITINGIHECNEQTMDGHEAADDMTIPFLTEGIVPKIQYPTMKNKTNECNQFTFAHIDYDKRILYTSWIDPTICLDLPDEEIYEWFLSTDSVEESTQEILDIKNDWKNQLSNIHKLTKQGWAFYFRIDDCPDECNCINSKMKNYHDDTISYRGYNKDKEESK